MSMHVARRAASTLYSRRTLPRVLRRLYATPPASDEPSTSTPTYTRPLAPGVLDVYDEALKLIAADQAKKRAQVQVLRAQLGELGADKEEERVTLSERIERLEIDAEINDPEVRWKHRQGLGELTIPVYRHLREQQWRSEGVLDRLMERIYQMHIIPDLLPRMDPKVDLELRFETTGEEDVEPGIFLKPEQTRNGPTIYATAYHTDERYYTLVMVDPDVPEPETQSFTSFLHWLVPNVSLSCLNTRPSLPAPLLPYIPPHPQAGSPYHRYTTLLLPQNGVIDTMKAPLRKGFSLREFVRTYSLQGEAKPEQDGGTASEVVGGGLHMYRELWDESVGEIHREVFGTPELKYGKPKKVDPYLNEEGIKPRRYY